MRVCRRAKSIPESTRKDSGGVSHVPKRTEVEDLNSLHTRRDNCPCSHDQQARQSAADRGQKDGWQEASP